MEKYKSEVLRLCNRPIDLENLPEDCPLVALIRMERDYQKTGTFNVRLTQEPYAFYRLCHI